MVVEIFVNRVSNLLAIIYEIGKLKMQLFSFHILIGDWDIGRIVVAVDQHFPSKGVITL